MPLTSAPRSGGKAKKILVLLALLALVVGGILLKRELSLPPAAVVDVSTDLPGVGRKTTLTVKADEPVFGIAKVTVNAEGAGLSKRQLAEIAPQSGPENRQPSATVSAVLGKESMPELVPGTLTVEVIVQSAGTRLRTPAPVVVTKQLEVRLDPPALASTSMFIHPAQGGAEAVVYEVGPTSVRDGVMAAGFFSPGFPLPGGAPTQRVALFAVPYDVVLTEAEAKGKIKLIAEDALGNRAEASFIHKYFSRPMGKDTIQLKDTFMQKVTGEIYARTPELQRKGTLLEDFLQLNGALRAANMQTLKEIAGKSAPAFLWSATFLPMQNAAVKGSFADRRTYLYDGKNVDTQDHLGFDLASLERAPVQAANDGQVVLARYFGIFGNAVVIDHGLGLQTLYAHLSTLGVKEGDSVKRGQEIGKTGATGLAGGDHLHFTTVLHGLPVNPIEWWDVHWIRDRLKLKLGDTLPWAEQKPVPPK
jgi:murein DD-endopeptidase MepM/ murein hydrolase activator NlpD